MVCSHNADKGDAVDIVALGDHLRAHQQVDVPAVQTIEKVFHVEPVADGIAIHAADAGLGKEFLQTLFALLRTGAQVKQMLALAFGASLGHRLHVSAIVTFEPLTRRTGNRLSREDGLVMGESDGAVLALQLLPASTA